MIAYGDDCKVKMRRGLPVKKNTLDAMATLLVVLVSGNPVVQYFLGKNAILLGVPVLLFCYGCLRGLRISKVDLLAVFLFALVGVIHFFTFGYGAAPAILGFLLKVISALLVVKTVKDFPGIYVRLMYWLAILSFVFYLPQILTGGSLREWMVPFSVPYTPGVVHVGLHNFSFETHEFRNSGLFWEPGAFAGYLLLALMFHYAQKLSMTMPLEMDKIASVLLIALLTTQSTAGYAALLLLVLLIVYLRFGIRHLGRLAGTFAAVSVIAGIAYMQLPFLSEKISGQLESAQSGAARSEINRFGNVSYDMESIKRRPILGWSPSIETRSIVDYEVSDVTSGQGNGLSGMVVRFGLIGLLIYAAFVFRSFFLLSGFRLYSLAALGAVLLLLMGEQYLNYPLFLTLMFSSRGTVFNSRSTSAATVKR